MPPVRQGTEAAADFVVVANRLPVHPDRGPSGEVRWQRSPGGLVSALEPILRSRRGAWVGWPGSTGPVGAALPQQGIGLAAVPLDEEEHRDYYEGFSNATLWPLFHDAVVPPVYDQRWWHSYERVNRRFAEHTAARAAPGATVWVQDYQLMLVPDLIRRLRPDVRIGFFLHIPFPPAELLLQLPWRTELVAGLLGADLVGFQLPGGANNFLLLAERLGCGRAERGPAGPGVLGTLRLPGRTVRVGAFPISIDTADFETLAGSAPVRQQARQIRDRLGADRRILLGVDRLDYTKGIDHRLRAYEELLAEGRVTARDTVLVQVATPSRERVAHYRAERALIEARVGRINGAYGEIGRAPVHYLHTTVDRVALAALYRAADVMLVTPLRDGMNLVAKEFVAARPDLGGALVLSEFAGAAAELAEARLVNPHHLAALKDAVAAALAQDPAEGRRRMAALRRRVRERDVDHWARSFLRALHGVRPEDGADPDGARRHPVSA
ncbi:trehalose-6-phosphate synthase [Kitasatospora sp. NPDC059571]|uniref:alpha,alpha-trehalose-phosphate synthase (UDP-forming) n=1 Tax=Kitasatospora sp. NPDC059571 TaxID=3346871 RepID=UPI0036A83332